MALNFMLLAHFSSCCDINICSYNAVSKLISEFDDVTDK